MNERSKERMRAQHQAIYDALLTFNLPVFEDEPTESEYPALLNMLFVVYGDFHKGGSIGHLNQEIYVVYVSEDNPDVETTTIDLISAVVKVSTVEFDRTIKERAQKKDSDDYIDQVTLVFKRKVAYEH